MKNIIKNNFEEYQSLANRCWDDKHNRCVKNDDDFCIKSEAKCKTNKGIWNEDLKYCKFVKKNN